ncbi:MAG: CoA transferase, partial [Acidimicrobiia bacterium]|nr:CoA transferase [Acidimicrobiia bacterium]
CVALGRADLADDPDYVDNAHRVANRGRLVAALSDVFATRPVSHWVDALSAAGVPAAPVRTLDQVFESPEGRATVVTVDDDERGDLRLVRSPWRGIGLGEDQHQAPPRLGEHTDDVRAWLATEGDP